MNSSGPSRPKAAAAVAAEMTKPRREMLCMMSSLDGLNLPDRREHKRGLNPGMQYTSAVTDF
jgi:hypothetical protein